MDKQRKMQLKKYVTWAVIALVVLILAVMPLLASQNTAADGPQASILTAQAETRDIPTQLIGGGQLSSHAARNVTIPEAVRLTEYLVGNGDIVQEGDPIARVDTVSVMKALAEVQETLDYLSGELSDARSNSDQEKVTAHAGGLVKILYGQEGDSVREVMLRHGALAVLSLDGRMAVDISRDTDLESGDTVCVFLSDDTEVEGRVESSVGGSLTVSLIDEGYAIGEKVTVKTEDGGRIGSGQLYIHNAWNAAAYYGTISRVNAAEGDTIAAGKTLFELEISDQSTQLQILNAQRQEYEALMQELFQLYHSGVLAAPCDGIVTGVDADGAFMLAAEESQGWIIQLLSNTGEEYNGEEGLPEDTSSEENPSGETTQPSEEEAPSAPGYTVLVGQVTAAAEGTLILNAYPETISCSSLSEVRIDTALMTASISRSIGGTTVWQKDLSTPYSTPIAAGDILFFVTDNNGGSYVVWAESRSLYSGTETQPQEGMTGGMGGGSMGGAVAVFEPYSLETLTIATVTSQEEMTLEITVDEQDISKLVTGQKATITVEALTGQSFPAVVSSIGNTGTNEGGSSKFTAKLTLSRSGDMLPGMNATAFLTLDTAENVLSVPAAALVEQGTQTMVYTAYSEKEGILEQPVVVSTGVSDGEYVQILSGLEEGDTLYYAYYDTLEISNVPEPGNFRFR